MLLALLLVAAPAPAQKTLAVLEFKSKLPKGSDVDVGYLTDVVRTRAKDAVPDLKVMTRENMLVLLQATGKKMEECEGECEVDTGRRVGADLVISGDVLKFGSQLKINMKLHDTHDGELLAGAQATGKDLDELDRDLNQAVQKLLAPLRSGAPAPVEPPRPRPVQQQPVSSTPPPSAPAEVKPAAPVNPFGFAAFALLGYYSLTVDASTSGGGTTTTATSEPTTGLGYGATAEVEWRASQAIGLGLQLEYSWLNVNSTTGSQTASVLDVGPVLRWHIDKVVLSGALTYSSMSDDIGGGIGLLLGFDWAISGPFAVHAELSGRSLSNTLSGIDFKTTVGSGMVGVGLLY